MGASLIGIAPVMPRAGTVGRSKGGEGAAISVSHAPPVTFSTYKRERVRQPAPPLRLGGGVSPADRQMREPKELTRCGPDGDAGERTRKAAAGRSPRITQARGASESSMSTLTHQLREPGVPPAEGRGDTWRQLEGPCCFFKQAWINSGVFLAPRGPSIADSSGGVTRDSLQCEVALPRRGVRERVHDVYFDIHQAAVAKLEAQIRPVP